MDLLAKDGGLFLIVTLQAQAVVVAGEQFIVHRTVGLVAVRTALFHADMLVDERALDFSMATQTGCTLTLHDRVHIDFTVDRMAIGALHLALGYPVMKLERELRRDGFVALQTEVIVRLATDDRRHVDGPWLRRMEIGRMAIPAADIGSGVVGGRPEREVLLVALLTQGRAL